MDLRQFEKISQDEKIAIESNIVAQALPLLIEGYSITLIHRKVQIETRHSRNLIEKVLTKHEAFKKLVQERRVTQFRHKRVHSWVA